MELRDKRELYNGYGDTLSRAIEFVATPCLLAWFGSFVDGRIGTGVVFTAVLGGLGALGMFMRTWFGYVAAMEAEEAKGPWRKI